VLGHGAVAAAGPLHTGIPSFFERLIDAIDASAVELRRLGCVFANSASGSFAPWTESPARCLA
jgi:hypothetical protein